MSEIKTQEKPANPINCPECGRDVCVLQDTDRKWTHRWRVLPRLVWLFLCLGLIGYWVSAGQWHYQSGQQQQHTLAAPAQGQANRPVYTTFFPAGLQERTPLIATSDFQEAIDGDPLALAQIMDKFDEPGKWMAVEGRPKIQTVQYGFKEPYGTLSNIRWYRFGGPLVFYSKNTMVRDLRDPSSVGRNLYQGNWGDAGWKFFPQLGYSNVQSDGAVETTFLISLTTLFGVLGVCIMIAGLARLFTRLFTRLFARVYGMTLARRRRYGTVLCGVLFLASVIVAVTFGKQEHASYGANHQLDIAQSSVYPIAEIESAATDRSKALELCRELLDLVPPGHDGDLLLAQSWKYESSQKSWARPKRISLMASLGRHGNAILHVDRRQYTEVLQGEEIPTQYRPPFWRDVRDHGVVNIQWGKPRDQWMVSIGVVQLVSIGVLFWIMWRAVHWVSRMALCRVQRRRVLLNRCIFCSYPLTAEGVNARYPVEPT